MTSQEKYLQEVTAIAKGYCKKFGYTFIFANDWKFGFEDKDGNLWTLTYMELVDKLKKEEK